MEFQLRARTLTISAVGAFFLLALGCQKMPAAFAALADRDTPTEVAASDAAQAHSLGLPDFTPLVEKCGPAVVNVEVIEHPHRHQVANRGSSSSDEDDPLAEFFRRFGLPGPGGFPGFGKKK